MELLAGVLDRAGASASQVTAAGWVAGVGACVAAGAAAWGVALGLWLANRVADGIDGALARRQGPTDLGGLFDVVADFSIYSGFLVGVAVALPDARLAAVSLLCAYYVSGTALLATSSLLERRRISHPDGRSLHLVGGLAEGTETILVYVAVCLFPGQVTPILWTFTAAVSVTVAQRVLFAGRMLRAPPDREGSFPVANRISG